MYSEELAAGILQISSRGPWTMEAWEQTRQRIEEYISNRTDTVYLLLNLGGSTAVEDDALAALMASRQFNHHNVGLAVIVARRAQLRQARLVLRQNPDMRDRTTLRFMNSLDDAFRVLLDRQVMDRIQQQTRNG